MDDFGPSNSLTDKGDGKGSKKKWYEPEGSQSGWEGGQKRKWLKAYEQAPAQLLNVYGEAKWHTLSDEKVWQDMSKELKSGAMYMSELCDAEDERRGVGANRGIHALLLYLQDMNSASEKDKNQKILKENIYAEAMMELDGILPSVEYLLAAKKEVEKSGAAALRGRASKASDVAGSKDDAELDRHAKILYEWMGTSKPSRIRGIMHWQAKGGLSFVASVHHRCLQCFLYHGNSLHVDKGRKHVTLEEFQACIKRRHAGSGADTGHDGAVSRPNDYT